VRPYAGFTPRRDSPNVSSRHGIRHRRRAEVLWGLASSGGESGDYRLPGLLRLAGAVAVSAYSLTYVQGVGHRSGSATPVVLILAAGLAAAAIAQTGRSLGASRHWAYALLVFDLLMFLGLASLYAADVGDDLFALMILVVIEGGLILGRRGALGVWMLTAMSYAVVQHVGGAHGGIPSDTGVTVLWLALLLIVAETAGVLSEATTRWKQDRAAYLGAERQFRSLVDNAPVAIYTFDTEVQVLSWNPAAEALFGWTAAEVIGRPLPLMADDELPVVARMVAWVGAGGRIEDFEVLRHHRDGTEIELSVSLAPIVDHYGDVTGLIATASDVTGRKRAEASSVRERSALELLEAVAVAANEADTFDIALQVCLDRVCAHTGWPVGHAFIIDNDSRELTSSMVWHMDDPRYLNLRTASDLTRVTAGAGFIGGVFASGERSSLLLEQQEGLQRQRVAEEAGLRQVTAFPILLRGKVEAALEFFSDGPMAIDDQLSALMANVTTQLGRVVERELAASLLTHQALHDPLTGLPNRTLFADRLSQALVRLHRQPSTVAVLFVDVDNFKVINDSLGHDQGDEILMQMARRLTGAVRPGDTVARFGGDEFVILCEEIHAEGEAVRIGERIRELAGAPMVVSGRDHFVTVSTGIALTSAAQTVPADLLRDADAAMYQAKAAGRARSTVFADSMRTRALHRLDTEIALRRAIAEGELRLYYQPIVNLTTGRTDAVEALVRWQHPTQGIIPPAEFIPIAEETGLIIPLGEWVLGEACRQANGWRRTYPQLSHMTMSVNLSGRQIAQPDLTDVVAHVLADSGLAPSGLVLEITESVLMGDAESAIVVLRRLKDLGVSLSVDDFGTGYSSLSYLKKFPVDVLKIDKSFVDGLGTEGEDTAIVRATINLAHSLGLSTVAEGTETPTQLKALTELGCDKAQGFLFSRPQPAESITESLLRSLVLANRPPGSPRPAPAARHPTP
jgi:diguanylate cyclase (GGDEF)-like protein/PAS domain S-box-containing protein